MATVTALTMQKKNKNRVNLFLDGEYFCSLDLTAAAAAGLKAGDEIDESHLKEVVERSEYSSALSRALKYLGIKSVSERQMRDYLFEKGYNGDITDRVVARLYQLNYLDDRAVAAAYVKACDGKYGNGLLRFKLKEKGISGEIIASVLPSGKEEAGNALKTAEKYSGINMIDRQKLYNYLFNKGFSAGAISVATESISDNIADNITDNTTDGE